MIGEEIGVVSQSRWSTVRFATVVLGNIGAPLRDGQSSVDDDIDETAENMTSSETLHEKHGSTEAIQLRTLSTECAATAGDSMRDDPQQLKHSEA